jgi:hypothetical protein
MYDSDPRHDDRTYAVQGELAVPSGATNYLPPFFMRLNPGEQAFLVGVEAMIRDNGSSPSVTISIEQNGSGTGLSDLTGIVVTPTATIFPLTTLQDVVNGDYFAPVITALTNNADNLTLTFFFDIYKAS